jgi:hypothetical protein
LRGPAVALCFAALALFSRAAALAQAGPEAGPACSNVAHKIGFDLERLDAEGLRGPSDGKVAVSYEFSIPDTAEHRAAVKEIDPTVVFMRGSRGRVGVREGECLCVGSTHQADYRRVLRRLAALPYIRRIIECHFE